MEYSRALVIAQALVAKLAPYCEKCEIAGGVRRRKPDPHDLEIVCIPRLESKPDLFGTAVPMPLLDPVLGTIGQQERGGPRYKKLLLPEGISLDLFLVLAPAQFGVIYALRTGPADYSKWLVTPRPHDGALPSYLKVADGAVWNGKEMLITPNEEDVFRALGLEWVAPELRCVPSRKESH